MIVLNTNPRTHTIKLIVSLREAYLPLCANGISSFTQMGFPALRKRNLLILI